MADLAFGTALTPLLPRYAHLAGLSEQTAGILMGAYALGGVIGAVPGGVIAGRLGSRTAAQLGLAAAAAAGLVLGWSSSAAALTGARFVQGAAGACTWAAGLAWLSGATPTARRG
jgi:MFS family permease